MLNIFSLQVVLVVLATALSLLAIFSGRQNWRKALALVLFAGLIGAGYFSISELLGRPKPARLATIVSGDAAVTVVAAYQIEKQAIYIWILRDNTTEPQAFSLPWTRKTAKKLHNAQLLAKIRGSKVRMSATKNRGVAKGEWVFHAAPVEKLPPKRARG